MSTFAIWINGTSVSSGYLAADPAQTLPTSHMVLAKRFTSLAEATAEIAQRGWKNATGVHPGLISAYVIEHLAPAVPKVFTITKSKTGRISVGLSANQNRPLGFATNPFGGLEFALVASETPSMDYCAAVFAQVEEI